MESGLIKMNIAKIRLGETRLNVISLPKVGTSFRDQVRVWSVNIH